MAIGSPAEPIGLGQLDGLGAATSVTAGSLDISSLNAKVVHVSVTAAAFIGAGQSGTIDNVKGMIVTPESGGAFLNVVGRNFINHVRTAADGRLCVVKVR